MGFRRSTRPSRWKCYDVAQTWACRMLPSRTCATAGPTMSSTGTDARCSSHTTCQGLGSPRSAHLVSLPSTTRRRFSSDGSPSSMHLTHGSALTKNSTILARGRQPTLRPSAARTACCFKSSTASRVRTPILKLEMSSMSVTATARAPQPPFLFRHSTLLLHSCFGRRRHKAAGTTSCHRSDHAQLGAAQGHRGEASLL